MRQRDRGQHHADAVCDLRRLGGLDAVVRKPDVAQLLDDSERDHPGREEEREAVEQTHYRELAGEVAVEGERVRDAVAGPARAAPVRDVEWQEVGAPVERLVSVAVEGGGGHGHPGLGLCAQLPHIRLVEAREG